MEANRKNKAMCEKGIFVILAVFAVVGLATEAEASDANLVGWWKLDEGGGATAYDSVGGNDGTIYGATWTMGQIGSYALDFNGVSNYVDLGNDAGLKPALPVTIGGWVKLLDSGKVQRIISIDEQSPKYYGIWLEVQATDKIGVSFGGGAGGASQAYRRSKVGTTALGVGTWYHLAAVVRGARDMDIYINGADDRGSYSGSGGSLAYSSGNSAIGYENGARYYFDGVVDDVRVYSRALTSGEILQLCEEGLGGRAFGPSPYDGERGVDPNVVLGWSAGTWAADVNGHDVYLGTDYDDVDNASTLSAEYMGNQDVNSWASDSYDPNGLAYLTRYYWRVDEINGPNTWKGDVWSFRTSDASFNLVGWWRFDEGSGITAYDSAGENDGTLVNGANWTNGQIGSALSFNGVGDYVDLSSTLQFDSSDFTITGWFRTGGDTMGRYEQIWNSGYDGGNHNLEVLVNDNNLRFTGRDSSGSFLPYMHAKYVNDNRWHHFAVLRRGNDFELYFDGGLGGSGSKVLGDLDAAGVVPRIGNGLNSVNNRHFDGVIDDVRVYGRALTGGEIEQIYGEGLGGRAFGPNPRNWASGVETDAILSWSSGKYAGSHDVYFGTGYTDVNEATSVSPEYMVRQDTNSWATADYDPCGLEEGRIYYWRVDEINEASGKSPWKGEVWKFRVGFLELHVRAEGSGEYPTIQAAIDAALDGDEVVLEPGTYTGNGNRDIEFLGKAVTVRSTDPNDRNIVAATIIDSNGISDHFSKFHRGFHFHSGEDSNSILSGLTITNGYENYGGGIRCYGSSPTITNCIVSGNTAAKGGGMYNENSNPTITNCTFTGNKSNVYGGGGMYNKNSNLTITNCTITHNISVGHHYGGGMHNKNSNLTITNCTIAHNIAESEREGGSGGGISNDSSSLNLTNCTFSNNSASGTINNTGTGHGGGVCNRYNSNVTLINCTFTNNSASKKGGGVYSYSSSLIVVNCVLWGNTSTKGGSQISGSATVRYSDVQGGWTGTGNIDAEPCFVDTNVSDYHLSEDSPCIDAGDPNYVGGPKETDIDGEPRIMGCRIDMGADEFTIVNAAPVACIVGGDRVVEAGEDCEAVVTLDSLCSSDEDSTEGTNDDINDFDWYDVIDVCEPNSDIYLGSGEVIECNLGLGEHLIILEVTDKACATDINEVTIIVEDVMAPVITLNGAETVILECGMGSYVEEGATATDNCDDDVAVVIGGDVVDTSACGTYVVTYDATDSSGNSAEQVLRTVIVEDTEPPELSLAVEPNVLWPPNGKMVQVRPEWEVSDNCDEQVEVSLVDISMSAAGDINDYVEIWDDGSIYLRARKSKGGSSRIYTLTYEAVDDAGNVTEASATVTVRHRRGPGKLGRGLVRRPGRRVYRRGVRRRGARE